MERLSSLSSAKLPNCRRASAPRIEVVRHLVVEIAFELPAVEQGSQAAQQFAPGFECTSR